MAYRRNEFPRRRCILRQVGLWWHAIAVSILAVGCSSGSQSTKEDSGAPVQQYVVDGVLTQLPSAPGRELMIRHVAIPEFVNASGDTVGMNAMTMGFPVTEESLLEGFAPGDTIRFVFEVRWGAVTPLRLTAMEHLPPGTSLFFGKVGEGAP